MVAAMSASAAPSDGVGRDQQPAPAPPGPVTPTLDTEQFKSSLAREESIPATAAAAAAECGVEEVAGLVEAAQLGEKKEKMTEIEISYIQYKDETQMPLIMRLIQKDLSEPYSIYTYRYFIHNWPHLCYLAMAGPVCVGAIVCKLDIHKKVSKRGYIAMLAVDSEFRKRRIGSTLVKKAIEAMVEDDADEVVLETEITNKPALKLYENLGFVRDKRLFRYYLNGVDASRLKLWLR